MTIYLIPFIAAFIGWLTNWVAIKMLFHPKRPVRFIGITIQGVFPKRQAQIARKLGSIVANDLLQMDELIGKIRNPEQLTSLSPFIEQHIDEFLQVKLKEKLPVVSMFVGAGMLQKIKEGLLEEIEVLLPQVIDRFASNLNSTMDIQRIVEDKVRAFSSDKLEEMLVSILNKEFRFVELVGGVLGFLIGLVQVLLTQL